MSILSWTLAVAPAQVPEYWLLCVDGCACTSLGNQAPYIGAGSYSVDLTKLDAKSPLPTDGAPHAYSVALVGNGIIGPQSAAVNFTLQLSAITVITGQLPPQPVWPIAETVSIT
jgi:hypothetical protein